MGCGDGFEGVDFVVLGGVELYFCFCVCVWCDELVYRRHSTHLR